jgi:NADPH-dependent 2,4-dienoyl-CoA reductase/sulfur reductase-like enzyme
MALLNTHATVKKFMHFGAKEDLAEAIVEAINEQNNELATKNQVALVEANLKSEIAVVRSEMNSMRTELKADIQNLGTELRADIRVLRSDGLWLKGILLIILGLLVKLTFFNG